MINMSTTSPANNPSRRRQSSRSHNAEDVALNQIAREAEARLSIKRAERAQAREIRMRELEKKQKEDEEKQDRAYSMGVSDKTSTMRSSAYRTSDEPGDDRDIRSQLHDLEDKYKKVMMNTAQLDNEKQALNYQVDLLKDKLYEQQETLVELQREYRDKCRQYEQQKRDSQQLEYNHGLLKEQLSQRDRLIQEQGLVIVGTETGELTLAKSPNHRGPVVQLGAALVTPEAAAILNSGGEGTLGTLYHTQACGEGLGDSTHGQQPLDLPGAENIVRNVSNDVDNAHERCMELDSSEKDDRAHDEIQLSPEHLPVTVDEGSVHQVIGHGSDLVTEDSDSDEDNDEDLFHDSVADFDNLNSESPESRTEGDVDDSGSLGGEQGEVTVSQTADVSSVGSLMSDSVSEENSVVVVADGEELLDLMILNPDVSGNIDSVDGVSLDRQVVPSVEPCDVEGEILEDKTLVTLEKPSAQVDSEVTTEDEGLVSDIPRVDCDGVVMDYMPDDTSDNEVEEDEENVMDAGSLGLGSRNDEVYVDTAADVEIAVGERDVSTSSEDELTDEISDLSDIKDGTDAIKMESVELPVPEVDDEELSTREDPGVLNDDVKPIVSEEESSSCETMRVEQNESTYDDSTLNVIYDFVGSIINSAVDEYLCHQDPGGDGSVIKSLEHPSLYRYVEYAQDVFDSIETEGDNVGVGDVMGAVSVSSDDQTFDSEKNSESVHKDQESQDSDGSVRVQDVTSPVFVSSDDQTFGSDRNSESVNEDEELEDSDGSVRVQDVTSPVSVSSDDQTFGSDRNSESVHKDQELEDSDGSVRVQDVTSPVSVSSDDQTFGSERNSESVNEDQELEDSDGSVRVQDVTSPVSVSSDDQTFGSERSTASVNKDGESPSCDESFKVGDVSSPVSTSDNQSLDVENSVSINKFQDLSDFDGSLLKEDTSDRSSQLIDDNLDSEAHFSESSSDEFEDAVDVLSGSDTENEDSTQAVETTLSTEATTGSDSWEGDRAVSQTESDETANVRASSLECSMSDITVDDGFVTDSFSQEESAVIPETASVVSVETTGSSDYDAEKRDIKDSLTSIDETEDSDVVVENSYSYPVGSNCEDGFFAGVVDKPMSNMELVEASSENNSNSGLGIVPGGSVNDDDSDVSEDKDIVHEEISSQESNFDISHDNQLVEDHVREITVADEIVVEDRNVITKPAKKTSTDVESLNVETESKVDSSFDFSLDSTGNMSLLSDIIGTLESNVMNEKPASDDSGTQKSDDSIQEETNDADTQGMSHKVSTPSDEIVIRQGKIERLDVESISKTISSYEDEVFVEYTSNVIDDDEIDDGLAYTLDDMNLSDADDDKRDEYGSVDSGMESKENLASPVESPSGPVLFYATENILEVDTLYDSEVVFGSSVSDPNIKGEKSPTAVTPRRSSLQAAYTKDDVMSPQDEAYLEAIKDRVKYSSTSEAPSTSKKGHKNKKSKGVKATPSFFKKMFKK